MKKRAFTKCVKIRTAKYDWLVENKGLYSIAGKLDEIINYYINGNHEAPSLELKALNQVAGRQTPRSVQP